VNGVVAQGDDRTPDPATRGHFVAGFEFAKHLLPLLLPALLGQNQHEIEDGENEHHHQYAEPRTASLLKE
jgi:hypothetical protein